MRLKGEKKHIFFFHYVNDATEACKESEKEKNSQSRVCILYKTTINVWGILCIHGVFEITYRDFIRIFPSYILFTKKKKLYPNTQKSISYVHIQTRIAIKNEFSLVRKIKL